jgi:hypothetical protein
MHRLVWKVARQKVGAFGTALAARYYSGKALVTLLVNLMRKMMRMKRSVQTTGGTGKTGEFGK